MVQGVDDLGRFHLYEVYKTPDDFKVHQTQPHYIKWRDAVADWFVQPRTNTKNQPIFFGEQAV